MSGVIGHKGGQIRLRSEEEAVNKWDAGDPIPLRQFSLSLDVILSTGEVPEEVPPVHIIELIREEVTEIFSESRQCHSLRLTRLVHRLRLSLHLTPDLIPLLKVGHHIAVDAREEHLHIAPVDQRATLLTLVVIGVIGRELIRPRIGDLGGRHRPPLSIVLRQRGVGLSIDQRSTTILLTREVVSEGKDISRSILIHRNIRVGSHQDHTISADTGKEKTHRHSQLSQSVSICPLGVPEVPDKSGNHDDRDDPTAAHEWNTQQDAGGEEAHPEECHRHGSSHRCIEGEPHH